MGLLRHDLTHTGTNNLRGRVRMRRGSVALLAIVPLVLGGIGALAQATPSGATVVAEGGAIVFGTPPAQVPSTTFESNSLIRAWTEQTAFTLPSAVPVDITPGTTFPKKYTGTSLQSPSTLASGTPVDSYFMYTDPVGQPSNFFGYNGQVTFSTPIIGVIINELTLSVTSPVVGAPGTSYQTIPFDGLENSRDAITLESPYTVHVHLETDNDLDEVRIITAASPSTSPGQIGGGALPGYTEVASDGGIFNFGTQFYGSMGGQPLNAPMVGGAEVTGEPGYWTDASDGGIFSFGDAGFYGSMGGKPLNEPIVGMASTPDGKGYWLVASDGGIFSFGDAGFYGSRGGKRLNSPIVGMAATPDGGGYWLVASDGGIFSYGDAPFLGSAGAIPLNKPVVGMTVTPNGGGYWLLASDGGVFSYGNASFYGSMGGQPLNQPMVAMKSTADGLGYWAIAADGGVFSFGDAPYLGSMGGIPLNKPIVGAF